MPTLRDYQRNAVNAVTAAAGQFHPAVQLPTGAGKTHVIGEIVRTYPAARCLVLAPSRELVDQNTTTISQYIDPSDVGVFCAGLRRKDKTNRVIVGTTASVHRWKDMPYWDIVIVDEGHLVPPHRSGMLNRILGQPHGWRIALSATPYRAQSGPIYGHGKPFDSLVYTAPTGQLIDDGWLSPLKTYAPIDADLTGVRTVAGEFNVRQMADRMEDVTESAVSDMLERTADRKNILVFGCTIAHGDHIRSLIESKTGESVAVVTEETPDKERTAIVDLFKSGDIRWLVNCAVFTTGFDAPNVDTIALFRATKSKGLYVQMVGRGLRIADGKSDCLVLDYGQNATRHGLLDDPAWEDGDDAPSQPRRCPKCRCVVPKKATICPACGHVFVVRRRVPNITNVADDRNPLDGSGHGTAVSIHRMTSMIKHTKSGVPALVIKFHPENPMERPIWKYVCLDHTNGARYFAVRFMRSFGIANADRLSVRSAHDMIVSGRVNTPNSVLVKRNPNGYMDVTDVKFD